MAICLTQAALADAPITLKDPQYNVTYWINSRAASPTELVAPLSKKLDLIFKHALFKDRVPSKMAILIDDSWTGASGYWSPSLKSPDGDAAVLFKSKAVLSDNQGWSILVHELTHLVHHAHRPHEKNWVREGIALMAEFFVTGVYNPVLASGFSEPETSLVGEVDPSLTEDDPKNSRVALYGHILQYFIYLNRLCGGSALYQELFFSKSKASGVEFIDETLRKMAKLSKSSNVVCGNFESSFRAFERARFEQNMLFENQYVLRSGFQASVRDEPLSLPPFSAMAYLMDKSNICHKNDQLIKRGVCLKLRLE